MINAALDLIEFLKSNFAFAFALAVYTVLAIALAKSIKKNEKVYYWIFGVISFCFIIPSVCRLVGVTLPFSLGNIPIVGLSASELSSAANFIHPVLVIIMYMGALSPKIPAVGRLMSIRKELSIIVGFPVLAHAVKRVFGSFPSGWNFFFNNEEYMASPRVSSALGSGITSFAFMLGLLMTILFLVLWITSFDSVRRKMGGKTWKSVQRWSYGLYAMLFLHSLCLSLGGLVSDKARAAQQAERQRAQVEVVEAPEVVEAIASDSVAVMAVAEAEVSREGAAPQERGQERPAAPAEGAAPQERPEAQAPQAQQAAHGPQAQQGQPQQGGQAPQAQQGPQAGHGHGPRAFTFSSIEISRATGRVINIIILFAVYGSYLVLRLRKAREDRNRRSQKMNNK